MLGNRYPIQLADIDQISSKPYVCDRGQTEKPLVIVGKLSVAEMDQLPVSYQPLLAKAVLGREEIHPIGNRYLRLKRKGEQTLMAC